MYPSRFSKTSIKKYSSIGAGAIILGGITIGEYAMIGAGALVTKDIPSRALVIGSPAHIVGWLNDDGTKMEKIGDHFIDNQGFAWDVENHTLVKLKSKNS
jgi:acetyltransferase-like isoleucine patch superfamily enzyme